MPFDNPPEVDAASLIELGMARIATPDRWCKHVLCSVENHQVLRRCALGSFRIDDAGTFRRYTDAVSEAISALNMVAQRRGFLCIASLNNNKNTQHADVLDAMREALADLQR